MSTTIQTAPWHERKTPTPVKLCVGCGREFHRRYTETYEKYSGRTHCSRQCSSKERIGIPRSPEIIAKMKITKKKNGYRPSREQIEVTRAKRLGVPLLKVHGANHWNWKGGITPLKNKIRKCVQMTAWRRAIFERDNYTCQKCGRRGGNMEADHIKTFAQILFENNIHSFEDALKCNELWDISNGRTMCVPCHDSEPNAGYDYRGIEHC